MSQSEIQNFFKIWLDKHGEANTIIKKSRGVLKAAVRGGVIICNTSTKVLILQYEELVSSGSKCFYKKAYKSLGHLPVGQSAFAA